jgi:PEP-CTERM motif
MHVLTRAGASLALAFCTAAASAAPFKFDGNLAFHNDVVRIDFHLDADTNGVRLWTDSFMRGLNFDPIIAVWSATTGRLIEANDDNPFVGRGQSIYDAGLRFDALAAGDYVLTLAAYGNAAVGDRLDAGFTLDGAAPIVLTDWRQPDAGKLRGSFYSLNLARVDAAMLSPVPEPQSWALFAGGLALLGVFGMNRRRRAGA